MDATYSWGMERTYKSLGRAKSTLTGIKKNFHKNLSNCRHDRTAGERLKNWRGSSNQNKSYTTTEKINCMYNVVL